MIHRPLSALLFAVLISLSSTSLAQPSELTSKTLEAIDDIQAQVVEWRRDFHMNPELSNREFRTASIVAAHLESLGIETTTGVAHTGVVGVLRGGKPGSVVALRADMDGLPVTERTDVPFASKAVGEYNGEQVGVMHACGHDTHVAIMMGVAEVLAGMRDELSGTVKFIFQPAEEGPPAGEEGGAKLMVAEGVLANPDVDAAFALHIDALRDVGTIGYREGGVWASVDDFQIVVKGKQSHGAYPWMGVDPVVASAHIITALQTVVSRNQPVINGAAVVSVGSIHGGVRSNIIPEEVKMVGTIRALDPQHRLDIHDDIRRIATNVAAGMGATAEVSIPFTMHYPVTYNDAALTALVVPALAAAAGADNLNLMDAETGAEDFAFFSEKVPGFYFALGGKPVDVPPSQTADHHTPDFFVDEAGMPLGVKAMVAVTLAYMDANAE
jgi:amidohydrolase